MATPSSSKKIQRVQRAGVTRSKGQRRPLGYTSLIVAMLVIGSVLVFLARDARQSSAQVAPNYLKKDHWHAAFGVFVCDKYLPNLKDATTTDVLGIHTHGDGLMHVHPFGLSSSGKNAQLGLWFDDTNLKVEDGKFTMPDGTVHKNGDTCSTGEKSTKKTHVVLFQWPPQASKDIKPKQITTDIASTRYREDGQIFALALVPDGTKNIELPPSVEQLKNPTAAEQGTPTPVTTAPGDTSTSVPTPAASTTVTPVSTTAAAPTTTAKTASSTTVKATPTTTPAPTTTKK